MKLSRGLSDRKLLARIGRLQRLNSVCEQALGFYLLDFDERRLFLKEGCASTAQFALLRFQIPPRRTREALRVARALEQLRLIDNAFARGRISWSAVREITRVAVKETEREWLDLALGAPLREIESAVSRTIRGELPPKDEYSLSKARLKIIAELPVEDYMIWETAIARLSSFCGEDLDSSKALVILARKFLEQPAGVGDAEDKGSAFRVVYHRCSKCDRAWVQHNEGVAGVPVESVVAIEAEAEVIRLPEAEPGARPGPGPEPVAGPGADPGGEAENDPRGSLGPFGSHGSHGSRGSRWSRGSQPVRPSPGCSTPERPQVPVAERDRPNSPLIRKRVLGRDGYRCAGPGCRSRRALYVHHVVWRSHGGPTVEENEVSLCSKCHDLIHEGLLTVEGTAPYGLIWRLPDGRRLENYDGGSAGIRNLQNQSTVRCM
jgi:5-methylcytosine-specific restriction endonuclease McrA